MFSTNLASRDMVFLLSGFPHFAVCHDNTVTVASPSRREGQYSICNTGQHITHHGYVPRTTLPRAHDTTISTCSAWNHFVDTSAQFTPSATSFSSLTPISDQQEPLKNARRRTEVTPPRPLCHESDCRTHWNHGSMWGIPRCILAGIPFVRFWAMGEPKLNMVWFDFPHHATFALPFPLLLVQGPSATLRCLAPAPRLS